MSDWLHVAMIAIYAASCAGCVAIFMHGLNGCDGWGRNNKNYPGLSDSILVGVAGLAVFPIINTVICLFFVVFLIDPRFLKDDTPAPTGEKE